MATSSQYGAFVPTTNIWDPQNIYQSNLDPELKEILVRMYQNLNLMANVLNVKETGQYNNAYEIVSSKTWFPNPALTSTTPTSPTDRQVIRKTFLLSLPPGATNLPHGLPVTTSWTFTLIYGTANDTVGFNYYPIASFGGGNSIEIRVDNVNIVLINNTAITFNITYIILEYLKF
jgi:hypothetical protein